jgi:hypothetical protein
MPVYLFRKLRNNKINLHHKDIMEYYGFFYNGLNDKHYYWFSFLTAVKVLLVIFNKVVTLHR